ncbi:MAG: hypothetical protein ACI3T9_04535 [Romboutsia timonensis]
MRNRYGVKRIEVNNPIDSVVTYGVFDISITDEQKIHCKQPYPNLIVECYLEEHALQIAYILNKDERARSND